MTTKSIFFYNVTLECMDSQQFFFLVT